ncbi:MAG: hypothetical protein II972_05850 [Elusimicrobiaceae bacterium]|nr:hypothetical protein [Elusimicrobiaceae bacterium]
MHFFAPKKVEDCPKCMQAIAQYRAAIIARNNPELLAYNESFYNQGGGINPGFKNLVSAKASSQAEPQLREYEKQLAQYRAKLAEKEKALKEAKRLEEEQAARERALIEQERAERLKQHQELQKAASISTTGGVGSSKTFTPRTTKQPTQQKTQIGTLKTSKLGESSFQNQRF